MKVPAANISLQRAAIRRLAAAELGSLGGGSLVSAALRYHQPGRRSVFRAAAIPEGSA